MMNIQSALPNILSQQEAPSLTGAGQNEERARQAAQEFEAFFLSQFLNSMTAGLETDETFGGGEAEKMFKSMLNDEYSKSMSRQNGVGIADAVYREILAMQEV
jgi:peptidoglycan hydrolase FlgJ